MKNREPDFTRYGRQKDRNRMNKVLNVLIAVVVLLIVVISVVIFNGNSDDKRADGDKVIETEKDKAEDSDSKVDLESAPSEEEKEEDLASEETVDSDKELEDKDEKTDKTELDNAEDDKDVNATDDSTKDTIIVTEPTLDKEIVSETIVDSAWQPIATEQSGEHISSYDGESVDWNEKKKAIAYAIGQPEDELIFWKVKNGGSPQKSIGIIESKTDSSKYRVYIEWVNNEGWKPVKKDVLKTLDFDY